MPRTIPAERLACVLAHIVSPKDSVNLGSHDRATGILPTAQQAVQDLRAQGDADATAFAPGPPGGLLMCFSSTGQGGIQCSDRSNQRGRSVGHWQNPSTLAEAAAKSRQLRDALEH